MKNYIRCLMIVALTLLHLISYSQTPADDRDKLDEMGIKQQDFFTLNESSQRQILDVSRLVDMPQIVELARLIEYAGLISKNDRGIQVDLDPLKQRYKKCVELGKNDPSAWQILMALPINKRDIENILRAASAHDIESLRRIDRLANATSATALGRETLALRWATFSLVGNYRHMNSDGARRTQRVLQSFTVADADKKLKNEAHWDDDALNRARAAVPGILAGGAVVSGALSEREPRPSQTTTQECARPGDSIYSSVNCFSYPVNDKGMVRGYDEKD